VLVFARRNNALLLCLKTDVCGQIHVEEWLATIQRSRGTKAKIRNIMSAVCSHAIRYGWMKTNPIRAVRQCAKRERIPVPLTAEEMQILFVELALRERTLVLLDVPTGMRRGELLAPKWHDIDFQKRTLNIRKSIWQQHLGPVKTEESEKTMPLDEEMIADLLRWRAETPYAKDDDFVFASPRMVGRQPLWPASPAGGGTVQRIVRIQSGEFDNHTTRGRDRSGAGESHLDGVGATRDARCVENLGRRVRGGLYGWPDCAWKIRSRGSNAVIECICDRGCNCVRPRARSPCGPYGDQVAPG